VGGGDYDDDDDDMMMMMMVQMMMMMMMMMTTTTTMTMAHPAEGEDAAATRARPHKLAPVGLVHAEDAILAPRGHHRRASG
jgi:hypothetical protein